MGGAARNHAFSWRSRESADAPNDVSSELACFVRQYAKAIGIAGVLITGRTHWTDILRGHRSDVLKRFHVAPCRLRREPPIYPRRLAADFESYGRGEQER